MEPLTYYSNRLNELKTGLDSLNRRKAILGWLRFAAIGAMILFSYLLFPGHAVSGWIADLALLVLFIRLVLMDVNNNAAIKQQEYLVEVIETEILSLDHNFTGNTGTIYSSPDHPYSADLDIFGHASLYQYINRSSSEMGDAQLAGWLSGPAGITEIRERQDAIRELAGIPEWREKLQAYALAAKIQASTQDRLQNWFNEKNRFLDNRYWSMISLAVPAVVVTVILLNILGIVDTPLRNYCLLASGILALYIAGKVTPLHQQVSRMADEMDVFAGSIRLIEQTRFKNEYLCRLQQQLIYEQGSASQSLRSLNRVLERLDLRLNIVVFIPLAVLFQWDLQQALALERWKRTHHSEVLGWFNTLGTLEALSTLATLQFNHPQWVFPVFTEGTFFIEGKEMGHPLIAPERRVTNPVNISKAGELVLVTGSNMAGKSTYLRSVGINTVLAMAGAPVCASHFQLSPMRVMSSMRIADNLEESTSTFYAELKKLRAIIESVNKGEPVFILLDEILRGTNSFDRHTGSAALIKQLIRHKASGILATHDIELAKLQESHPGNIRNFHFDVQVDKGELFFDYRLQEGICKSMNASILMKKIGIEL